jgi:hypothetical protein
VTSTAPVPTHAHIDSLLAFTARDAEVLAEAGEQLKRDALGVLGADRAAAETRRDAHLRLRAADDFVAASEIIRARMDAA